ncbi:protein BASIC PENTACYSTEINE6-like [Abeliophyllum distichum]|uniref:Protein BASIC PENTACYSTEINE6-like n=1 Tax=Abeliophyllum distichum TaxID=126358 RepID=A0ABD1VP71_9LAMI
MRREGRGFLPSPVAVDRGGEKSPPFSARNQGGTKSLLCAKPVTSTRKTTKSSKKVKQESEDVDRTLFRKSQEAKSGPDMGVSSDELNRQLGGEKPDWKDQDLGLN